MLGASCLGLLHCRTPLSPTACLPQYIPHIKTPTLFVVSLDDPFLGVLPDQEVAANPHTVLAATAHGGHCAFLQARTLPDRLPGRCCP